MVKIFSWNVNGFRQIVKSGFQKFLDEYQPDVLCLQEIKIDAVARAKAEYNFPGYIEYWNCAAKKGYSGTAIFTKIKPLTVVNDFPEIITKKFKLTDNEKRDSNEEGRIIAAEFEKFWLVNVYTPNAKDDLSRIPLRHKQWDPAFLTYLKQLEHSPSTSSGQAKPVIFCGDLNVAHTPDDIARPKANEGRKGFTLEEREGFQNFIDAGFIDTFRLFKKGNGYYTWWTYWANARANNVGWRIDYFLASESLKPKIKDSIIHDEVFGSDHCPIELKINL